MDPIPVSTPAPGLAPSNSTVGSGAGSVVGIVIVGVLKHYGWDVDPVFAAAIAGLCGAAIGYLPASGRR